MDRWISVYSQQETYFQVITEVVRYFQILIGDVVKSDKNKTVTI